MKKRKQIKVLKAKIAELEKQLMLLKSGELVCSFCNKVHVGPDVCRPELIIRHFDPTMPM